MLRIMVTPDDLLRIRFAISPLFELEALLRKLRRGSLSELSPRMSAQLDPIYAKLRRDTDLDAAMFLMTPRRTANFVCAPVEGMDRTIDDDLADIRSAALEKARSDVSWCRALWPAGQSSPSVLDSDQVVERVATSLERAWHELLADRWAALRTILERDIAQRVEQLGRTGWLVALGDLVEGVRCSADAIELPWKNDDMTLTLEGEGMMFVPSIFVWPSCVVHTFRTPRKLIYPSRGVGVLRETDAPTESMALADLLGTTRARILCALDTGSSTTQLSRFLGLPTGSVNDHLSALFRAGLLEKARMGRSVLYYRTPLGDALASRER